MPIMTHHAERGRPLTGAQVAGQAAVDAPEIPVDGGRVACPLLGEVELDRCLECDHLIRIDWAGGGTAHGVVCVYRGEDFGDNLAW